MNTKQRIMYGAYAFVAILMIIGLGSVYARSHQDTSIPTGQTVADPDATQQTPPLTPTYTGKGIADPDPQVPDQSPVDDPRDYVSSDNVTQSYYYCWNSGAPSPHHLGYYVSNDHLCTDAELGR